MYFFNVLKKSNIFNLSLQESTFSNLLPFASKPLKKIAMWNVFQDQHDGL